MDRESATCSRYQEAEQSLEKMGFESRRFPLRGMPVHPSGNEHSPKSPANSFAGRKKGRAVGPSLGPSAQISDELQTQLLALIQLFLDADDARRNELVELAAILFGKS